MVSPGRVAFSIGGFDIMWYGVMIGTAFILAMIISYYRAPKIGVNPEHFLDFMIWLIPAAVIGARAYYVIFKWDQYRGDLHAIFSIRSGGLAIHGGVILGFITAYIVCRVTKEKYLNMTDLVVPVLAMGQAIGRWGNFFNEEAHGVETDLPWAQIIDGVGYHPTFLYESIWCFLLFIFLLWFSDKKRTFRGQLTCLYFILYSFERFWVEALRTDSLMVGPFRQARVLSVVLIIGCLILYTILKKNPKFSISKSTETSAESDLIAGEKATEADVATTIETSEIKEEATVVEEIVEDNNEEISDLKVEKETSEEITEETKETTTETEDIK